MDLLLVISGPVDPVLMAFLVTKYLKNIMKLYGDILEKYYFDFLELQKFVKIGPTKHLFFLKNVPPTPQKISFSERFQRIFRWWNLGILGQSYFWNYWNISKSYWIKNIFQVVTSHISKKVSPRTFLVFMENHPVENFSPHTFLVFMENHGFEL